MIFQLCCAFAVMLQQPSLPTKVAARVEALHSGAPSARSAALREIVRDKAHPAYLYALVEALEDSDAGVRREAVRAVASRYVDLTAALQEARYDADIAERPNPYPRKVEEVRAIMAIRDYAASGERQAKREAFRALTRFAGQAGLPGPISYGCGTSYIESPQFSADMELRAIAKANPTLLDELLRDPDPTVVYQAGILMPDEQLARQTSAVLNAYHSANLVAHYVGVSLLARLPHPNPLARLPWVLLDSTEPYIADYAALVCKADLKSLESDLFESTPPLSKATRVWLACHIGNLPREDSGGIIERALADPDEDVRAVVVPWLDESRILELTSDPSGAVRASALASLWDSEPKSLGRLAARLALDPDPRVREVALPHLQWVEDVDLTEVIIRSVELGVGNPERIAGVVRRSSAASKATSWLSSPNLSLRRLGLAVLGADPATGPVWLAEIQATDERALWALENMPPKVALPAQALEARYATAGPPLRDALIDRLTDAADTDAVAAALRIAAKLPAAERVEVKRKLAYGLMLARRT